MTITVSDHIPAVRASQVDLVKIGSEWLTCQVGTFEVRPFVIGIGEISAAVPQVAMVAPAGYRFTDEEGSVIAGPLSAI